MTNPTVCTCTIAYSSDTVPSFAINCPLHEIGGTLPGGAVPQTTVISVEALLAQLRELVTKWEGEAHNLRLYTGTADNPVTNRTRLDVNARAYALEDAARDLRAVLDGTDEQSDLAADLKEVARAADDSR